MCDKTETPKIQIDCKCLRTFWIAVSYKGTYFTCPYCSQRFKVTSNAGEKWECKYVG